MRKLRTLLVRCDVTKDENACGLLQLGHTFPSEILYANYWYRSDVNDTMRNHLKGIVATARNLIPVGKLRVLDIGCNDGTLLRCYPDDFECYGVDPSDIAREIGQPIKVINTTFPSEPAVREFGDRKIDIVTSIAMFYDLEDPLEFARCIRNILSPSGIWIFEMSYMPTMLKKNSFDTICHEHLEYYSFAVLEYIMQKVSLRIFHAELNDINGGSIRCYVTHAGNDAYDTNDTKAVLRQLRVSEFDLALDTDHPYLAFFERICALRKELKDFLLSIKAKGKTIHVYGASTKGNVLLQWCGIDNKIVDCAADRNPDKDGARTIGTNIPIVLEEKSRALKPDYYLVLPWHFRDEFLRREKQTLALGTSMIFPLPCVSVVSAMGETQVTGLPNVASV